MRYGPLTDERRIPWYDNPEGWFWDGETGVHVRRGSNGRLVTRPPRRGSGNEPTPEAQKAIRAANFLERLGIKIDKNG